MINLLCSSSDVHDASHGVEIKRPVCRCAVAFRNLLRIAPGSKRSMLASSRSASGGLPDGSEFTGVEGLEQALLDRPELFVRTLTEKLLTFALGRGVEYHDAPAVRRIVRDARDDDYRFSSLIVGIVKSTPFLMRATE